ncbi:kinase-like protein [Peniophora sp. CONT]|nr:kinase-like protein [Peniophora sp. CONT]
MSTMQSSADADHTHTELLFSVGRVVDKRFVLASHALAVGAHGVVYAAIDMDTSTDSESVSDTEIRADVRALFSVPPPDIETRRVVVVKIDTSSTYGDPDCQTLKEINVYRRLAGCPFVPRYIWSGKHEGNHALALERLGPSIERICVEYGWDTPWPVPCVLLAARGILAALKELHGRGFVHRDLSFGNILLASSVTELALADGDALDDRAFSGGCFLTDFGTAASYLDGDGCGRHIANDGCETTLVGTEAFSSHRDGSGISLTRRDDMESLAYLLVRLSKGSLPWELEKGTAEGMQAMKRAVNSRSLCAGLPSSILAVIQHARALNFDEAPDYARLNAALVGDYTTEIARAVGIDQLPEKTIGQLQVLKQLSAGLKINADSVGSTDA